MALHIATNHAFRLLALPLTIYRLVDVTELEESLSQVPFRTYRIALILISDPILAEAILR